MPKSANQRIDRHIKRVKTLVRRHCSPRCRAPMVSCSSCPKHTEIQKEFDRIDELREEMSLREVSV